MSLLPDEGNLLKTHLPDDGDFPVTHRPLRENHKVEGLQTNLEEGLAILPVEDPQLNPKDVILHAGDLPVILLDGGRQGPQMSQEEGQGLQDDQGQGQSPPLLREMGETTGNKDQSLPQ